ncbi:transcription factor ces-2-like [Lineus longissimus]|uniref:transcription factor ces-2-like n=1 Tax=Lineus longissimus TaxID=88925 RepID=UPI00315C9DEB
MTTDAVDGVLDLSTTANSCSEEEGPHRPRESDEHMTSSEDELHISVDEVSEDEAPPMKRHRGVVRPVAGPLPSNHIPLNIETAQSEPISPGTRPFKLYQFDSLPPVYSTHVYGQPLLDNAMFSPLTSYFNNKKRRAADKRIEIEDKKMTPTPEDSKDNSYWERRRKNNEAAKRSRDTRRQKEEHVAMKAAYLEQENLKLRAQVALLKNETAKLHFMLYNRAST